jgi:hypothetical protein
MIATEQIWVLGHQPTYRREHLLLLLGGQHRDHAMAKHIVGQRNHILFA